MSGPQILRTSSLISREVLLAGSEALQAGGLIAIPTDTIYGIAALSQNTAAVNKIYHLKRRQRSKPVAICVGTVPEVYKWCHVTIEEELLSRLLPGPVTLVFNRKPQLNKELNPGTTLVGVRIPRHAFIQVLCKELGEPIALTSANLSDTVSSLSVDEFKNLWPDLDVICDGGKIEGTEEQRLGSTVVNLSQPDKYTIIRPGSAYTRTVKILQDFGLTPTSTNTQLINSCSS